jgi:exopolyphosphatase/guanosine-5'-triphosphate,3'-diphosphate pyrophosphatase
MPGFTDQERLIIAALCRFHRKAMPHPRHPYFQALDPESRRLVSGLEPLLRVADALDRGHRQKVRNLGSTLKDGTINLLIETEGDADLEIWAANEAAKTFPAVYATAVQLQRARAQRA